MEYKEIEILLRHYMDGDSTLEEESMLKEYFAQPELPAEYREMQEMFRYFVEAKLESAPSFDMTKELNSFIDSEWKKESVNRFRRVYTWAGSAVAVLIISFGLLQYLNKPQPIIKDTYKDPKLAYLETKMALMKVSRVMNRNTSKLKYLEKVDESFDHIQKIAQIDKVVNSVKNTQK